MGGAKDLDENIASKINAIPVVTTASDVYNKSINKTLKKNLVLGVGCRKNIDIEHFERIVTILLWDFKISFKQICAIATINIKKEEKALLDFSRAYKIPVFFYSSEELNSVNGNFVVSERVKRVTGVDNVCERAATICGGKGKLLIPKTCKEGITIAVFEKEVQCG